MKANFHPYPKRISLRAQKLLQGSLFYFIFLDTATGLYLSKSHDPEKDVREALISKANWEVKTYEISWDCFTEYVNEFLNPIQQQVIFSMVSHWDWFVSKIGKFINFANHELNLLSQSEKDLNNLSLKPFTKQLEIIKSASSIPFNIKPASIELIEELHLVRNLGLHNEWEVDELYLQRSKSSGYKVGQKRNVDMSEINSWHKAFVDLITSLSDEIATRYYSVSSYDE